jgi:hypothetical protein
VDHGKSDVRKPKVFLIFYADQKDKSLSLASREPNKSWKKPENVRNFLGFLEKELHVADPEDWYRIGKPQIAKLGGSSRVLNYFEQILHRFTNFLGAGLLRTFGNLHGVLKFAYPEITWDERNFLRAQKKSVQRFVEGEGEMKKEEMENRGSEKEKRGDEVREPKESEIYSSYYQRWLAVHTKQIFSEKS